MPGFVMVAIVWLLLSPSTCWSDVVELKTGQRVEGTFRGANSDSVTIEVGGQAITFEREKVRAIYLGSAPTSQVIPSALDEAMKALKGLQSVVSGGISYREYAPRVSDAKVIVDRYLNSAEASEQSIRQSVSDAMALYVVASTAWNGRVVRGGAEQFSAAGRDPVLQKCPVALRGAEESRRRDPAPPILGEAYGIGSALAFGGLPALWSCASEKISEAEQGMKTLRGK
jgi:hypothetical protein